MSGRESPAAVITRTTESLVSPPPTTISNELMTTPAISSALRTNCHANSCPGRSRSTPVLCSMAGIVLSAAAVTF